MSAPTLDELIAEAERQESLERKTLAQYEAVLQPGHPELVRGRLSLQHTVAKSAALVAALCELRNVVTACEDVAPDNVARIAGATVDEDLDRYLIIGESGVPILEADEPAEVVRRLNELWTEVSDLFERESTRAKAAEAELQRLQKLLADAANVLDPNLGSTSLNLSSPDVRQLREGMLAASRGEVARG
jgi:hypothetical protein